MTAGKIDHLIINSPYEEPRLYWKRDERTGEFFKESGRRPAGYVVANPESTSLEDPDDSSPLNWSKPFARASNDGGKRDTPARQALAVSCSSIGGISNSAATCAASSFVNWTPSRLLSG